MNRTSALFPLLLALCLTSCENPSTVDPATLERSRFPAEAVYFTLNPWTPAATVARTRARYDNWELVAQGTLCSAPTSTQILLARGDSVVLYSLRTSSSTMTLSPPDGVGAVTPVSAIIDRKGEMVAYFARSNASDGPARLYVQAVPGGAPRLLANNARPTDIPAFSPDGGKIAYYTYTDGLAIVPVDGGAPATISAAGTILGGTTNAPAWSPDGGRIAYTFMSAGNSGIATVAPDGTGARTVVEPGTLGPIFTLTWSPDGKRIGFDHGTSTRPPSAAILSSVAAEGGSLITYLDSRGDNLPAGTLRPQWSTDEHAILYVARPDVQSGYAGVSWVDTESREIGRLSPGFYTSAFWQLLP